MLGRLNLFGYALVPGTVGLHWFYGRLFPGVSSWVVWGILFLPWYTIHAITFAKVPPFGARPFRRCLLAVVCAFGLLVVGAEIIQFVYHLPAEGSFSLTIARILTYCGCICFVPFVRAYLTLRDSEATHGT